MKKLKNNHLLWKATNIESGIESYIYGTIHLRDKKVYFLLDKVKSLIDKCDVFIAEYPLDDAGDMKIMEALQLPEGKHLQDIISAKKYSKTKKYIKNSFNLDLDRFGYFRPMVIENMMTESMFESDYSFPMDIVLWNYAKEKSIKLIGAETTESQIEIINRLSLNKQIKSFIDISKNIKKFRKKMKMLVSYYKKQNLIELHRKTLKSLGKMKKILVYERNKKIVNTILDYTNESKGFVAVGAGHLLGENGILRLMKKNGYIIEPVKI